MRRAYLVGAGLVIQCWALVVTLWLVNVAFGAGFFVASGGWLTHVLGHSVATRTLLYDLDPSIFIDLYYQQDSGAPMLAGIALLMAVAYTLLWCWLHGVVILETYSKGRMALAEAFLRGAQLFPRILRLLLMATAVLALFTAVISIALWAALSATWARPSEMLWYWIAATAGTTWLVGYVFLVAVHDHARIRACATGEGAARAYWWALRFVFRGGEHAFLLAVALNVTALVVWAVFEAVGLTWQAGAGLGTAKALLWGELFLLFRMTLRVWFFAAQGDLQSPP